MDELTPEEKLAQVELEKLREIEEMEKEKKMADIKAGRAFAEQTIQPMSDPASSDEDSNPPLLGEYEAEDLSNNLPKKQKEKAIKNTVPDHLNKPQFSDSSDSEGGEIVDPTMYDPRDLQPFSQSTNPELTNNVMELTQNRIRQNEKIAAERRAASLAEAMETKEEPHEDVKMEPMEENLIIQEKSLGGDIKSEIKSEPTEDNKPVQQDLKSKEITNKADINILNPIAGAIHVPKFKQQPRHNKTNPLGKEHIRTITRVQKLFLVQNIQSHARSQVPDKIKKNKGDKDIVRSFLPNMNPYQHRCVFISSPIIRTCGM